MDEMNFSVDMGGLDRSQVLATAATKLDALGGHMGQGSAAGTSIGDLARELQEDTAEFAAAPLVYEITDADFERRDGRLPEGFQQLSRHYRFYFVELPIHLFPRYGWSFDRLEVAVEFNAADRDRPELRPRALQIFPNRQLREFARVDQQLMVSLTSELQFEARVPEMPLGPATASAAAGAKAAGEVRLGIGPFEYRLRRAEIDHSPAGLEKVFWRLDGVRILQDDAPRLIIITQVPRATSNVDVDAALQAYRNYNFLTDRTRNTIEQLPRILSTFFKKGAPMRADAHYRDITRNT